MPNLSNVDDFKIPLHKAAFPLTDVLGRSRQSIPARRTQRYDCGTHHPRPRTGKSRLASMSSLNGS